MSVYQNTKVPWEKTYHVRRGEHASDYELKGSQSHFRLDQPVPYQFDNPTEIKIELVAGDSHLSQLIHCQYHTISGNITDVDGKPFQAYSAMPVIDFVGLTCEQ